MTAELPIIAGTISTLVFAASTLPMLVKAFSSKNLASYSLGHIVLANSGNVIHSLYVFSLPMGPIWLLHTFYTITTGMMLLWYLRYEGVPWRTVTTGQRKERGEEGPSPESPLSFHSDVTPRV